MTKMQQIQTLEGDDKFDAYVARPEGTPTAAVIVIQEVFGINAGIRRKCNAIAEAGYLAIAPDLFWRLERNVELDPDIEAEFARAIALMQKFDEDAGIRDIEATIRTAREMVNGGKVGCVGYCLGGRIAYLTATRTDIDASVGYYGVGIANNLHEKHAISRPLMLHIAGEDGFVDKDQQKAMHEGLDDHPKVTLHDYAGEDHGFATEFGKRRSDEAARLADKRTADFFTQNLS